MEGRIAYKKPTIGFMRGREQPRVPHRTAAPTPIRFRPNTGKILEGLVLVANELPGVDVFHICKIFYFADKKHLNMYGRPIFGDQYFALKQGPVPSTAYDMVERDEKNLYGDLLVQLSEGLSFYKAETDDYLRLKAKRSPDMEVFSESDVEYLKDSIARYGNMDFDTLWNLAHAEPAYTAVYKEGQKRAPMEYEMILNPQNPHYDEILNDLRENAKIILL